MTETLDLTTFILLDALKRTDRSISVSPDLIAKLLEQIRPRPDCEAACREHARKDIGAIRSLWQFADSASSTAVKMELERFQCALQKVRGMASGLSPVARWLIFGGEKDEKYEFFVEELDQLIEWEIVPSLIPLRKRAPSKRLSKVAAATFARALMENYSDFPPRLTKNGAFFCIASLLFEGATGKRADLTKYCRLRR
jgi:hypothetical protein